MSIRAQVSLEYLIVLLGFFSALAVILPSISFSIDAFLEANDSILARQISERVQEQVSLFGFLGDGSKKTFEFVPAKKITIQSKDKTVFFSTNAKSFLAVFDEPQIIPKQEFSKKFFIELKKTNGKTSILVYSK